VIPIGDSRRLPMFPLVGYAIVALNIYVVLKEAAARDTDVFINAFAAIPYDVTHNVVLATPSPPLPALTILTSIFLHGSILHIFFNMLFFVVFGAETDCLCDHGRFAVLYLLCGIAGGIAQIAIGPGSHVPSIGASGAIAGVLGAYLINFPTARINTIVPIGCFPLFLRLPAVLVIGVWAVTQFLHGFGALSDKVASEQGGTAYFAHIGGFCAGVLLIGFFATRANSPRAYRYHW